MLLLLLLRELIAKLSTLSIAIRHHVRLKLTKAITIGLSLLLLAEESVAGVEHVRTCLILKRDLSELLLLLLLLVVLTVRSWESR